jgi:hypothetical protein
VLVSRRGCHGRDSRVVLIESRGNEATAQEGMSWILPVGVLLVHVWSRLLLMWLLLFLFLSLYSKHDFWVAGVVPRQLQSFIGRLRAQ